ncbi:hypothetical protein LTR86_010437 [Recurvomyces mirabilis]|nr:hypothetical protein LTR86_010437 [Recurvomyces mirabilis]
MCVRIADELNLFDLLVANSPITIAQLADTTGASSGLIARLFRTLVGMGFVRQIDHEHFASTAVTKQMTLPSVRAGVRFFYDQGFPILSKAPAYFKHNGHRLPEGMLDGPFQFTHNTSEDCYTFWSKQSGVMENFNTFMQGLFGTPMRLGWLDWFPIQEICLAGFDRGKSEYCFVDVGGGKGHEGEAVLKKFPGVQGKFVVQDLPFVIKDIAYLDSRVERMAHDFTTPQPVKGARVYFLQNILHNWASPVCHTILSNLRAAMIPGYSKILIGNIILPEENVPLRNSGLDIAMLFLHSGAQRSEAEWRGLVEGAGLAVEKVWYPPGDGDGIVEVMRPYE